MRCCQALRRKAPVPPSGSKCGDGDRDIWWPEYGRAGLRDAAVRNVSQNRQRRDIGDLALVSRHAKGGVAFHVLDRTEPLLNCDTDVLGGHVVLHVQPGATPALDKPERTDGKFRVFRFRQIRRPGLFPKRLQRLRCGTVAIGDATGRREHASGRTCRRETRHGVLGWHERGDILAPDRFASHVAGQVDCGVSIRPKPQGSRTRSHASRPPRKP